jgi:hypothetical protein
VIPVILKFADSGTSPFHQLQALPANAKPVTDWRNRDEAYLDVAVGIRRVISRLRGEPVSESAPIGAEAVWRDRVLDAAIAARIPLGKPSDLAVMPRLAGSAGPGLRRKDRKYAVSELHQLTDELIDITFAQTDANVVLPAHIDLGEDIFKTRIAVLLIHVIHATRDVEECDHLVDVFVYVERVGFARRLEDVIARARHPIVFQISPRAFDHITMHRRGMPVPAQDTGFPHPQQVAPLAGERVEHQRPEPDIGRLRNPDALVFGHGGGDNLIG